jgi:hypothetical protein
MVRVILKEICSHAEEGLSKASIHPCCNLAANKIRYTKENLA